MLTLAFDTATDVATSALVWDGEVLGELRSRPVSVLEDVDALFRRGGVRPAHSSRRSSSAPGRGASPACGWGSRRRARSRSRSTSPSRGLDARRARRGRPGALPVIDARRSEVFVLDDEPRVSRPEELDVRGRVCVGDGAVRYRVTLEEHGAEIPPDDDERHVPRARFHVALAGDFGPAEGVEPIYLRIPDAEKARA